LLRSTFVVMLLSLSRSLLRVGLASEQQLGRALLGGGLLSAFHTQPPLPAQWSPQAMATQETYPNLPEQWSEGLTDENGQPMSKR
jgi:hypothetical protein